MTIGFDITQTDDLAFQAHYMATDGSYKATLRRLKITFPLLVVLLMFFLMLIFRTGNSGPANMFYTISPVLLICLCNTQKRCNCRRN